MRARRKIAAVCLAAAATVSGCAASDLIGPGATADYSSMFEDMWTQFDLHYSYFDLRGVDWNAIGARYRPQAAAVTTDVQFANVLGSMLKELQDLHVSLTPTGAGGTVRWYSPYETSEPTVNINAILGKYLTSSFVTTGGHIRGGFVAPGIGSPSLVHCTSVGGSLKPTASDNISCTCSPGGTRTRLGPGGAAMPFTISLVIASVVRPARTGSGACPQAAPTAAHRPIMIPIAFIFSPF